MSGESGSSAARARRKADPKPVISGAVVSLIFLVTLFYLQSRTGPLAKIPEAFLWFSLVPLVIGLFLGGYISGVKWGDFEIGIPKTAEEQLQRVEAQSPVPPSMTVEETGICAPASPAPESASPRDGLIANYQQEYETNRQHYMLAHIYRPTKAPGQFDIYIFVVLHKRGSYGTPQMTFTDIEKAEFCLGPSWRNEIFEVTNSGGLIGIRTRAWGTFFASCSLTFKGERKPVVLFRFVDFYMDPAYQQEAFSAAGS